jgi:DNA-binding MarR family transcriptional regulator
MSGPHHVLHRLVALMEQARQLMLAAEVDGLRPSHYRILDSVPSDDVINITELSERVGITKQGIGQFVTHLEHHGHLVTESDPDDRRVRLVRRTQRGDEALEQVEHLLAGLEAQWADLVGARQYRDFRRTLDSIADASSAIIPTHATGEPPNTATGVDTGAARGR